MLMLQLAATKHSWLRWSLSLTFKQNEHAVFALHFVRFSPDIRIWRGFSRRPSRGWSFSETSIQARHLRL
jgi:hypothetical protein